jgi:hypothetical protein
MAHQTVAAYHKRDESLAAANLEKQQQQMGYGVGIDNIDGGTGG